MAKKQPPKDPTPPIDDFDPDRDLNEEVAPLEDDLGDDLVDVAAEDDLIVEPDDAPVLEPDELVESDPLATVVTPARTPSKKVADDDLVLDESDLEEVVSEEVVVDDLVLDEDVVDENLVVDDEPVDPDLVSVSVEDDDLAADPEAFADAPAVDPDDPFAGVGGELDETDAVVDDDGNLVPAGVGADDSLDNLEEPYEEEEVPKPATHWLTWTLIGLNVIAAFVVPYLLIVSYQKRQEYTYAVFRLDLAMLGLPSEEEEKTLTAARATLPGYRISKEEIKRIVGARVPGAGGNDPFEDVDEQIIRRIPPSMLDRDILKEHFGNDLYLESGGQPIATIEDEIRRIQKSILPDIEKVAKDSLDAGPSEAVKRTRIDRLLLPLAMNTTVADALAARVKNAKGAELDKLYVEAIQRRMAFDFLLPLELFRPGDTKGIFVEQFGNIAGLIMPKDIDRAKDLNVQELPLADVLARVTKRIQSTIDKNYEPAVHLGEEWGKQQRDTIEKRLTVAFTLLSLAHLKKPDGELLYPKLLERIPLVVGQYDFSLACELFPARLLNMNERVLERIQIDREGFVTPDKGGALVRGKAFIDYYEDELQRIRFMQQDIFKAKIRLNDLKDQKARYETLLAERTKQRADILERIAKARAKTAKDIEELRVFQSELFRYQVELATSEDDLARLHDQINDSLGKKGGKK